MSDLLALAGNWQAAIASIVAAALIGFQVYLKTRRDLRDDKQGESASNAYSKVIEMLQEEILRLQKDNIQLRVELEHLRKACEDCRIKANHLEQIVELRKKPR